MSTLALALAMSLASPPATAAAVAAGAVDGPAAFERVKKLEGSWKTDAKEAAQYVMVRLVAGGTAVLETVTGADRTNVTSMTVYAMEGAELVATHYGATGATRLRVKSLDGQQLVFEPHSKEPKVLGLTLGLAEGKLKQDWALREGYREVKKSVALLREYVDTLK